MIMDRAPRDLAWYRSRPGEFEDEIGAEGLHANIPHLVSSLVEMARAGIAYNDLRAANIIVGSDGRWRFIDFGMARVTSPQSAVASLEDRMDDIQRMLYEFIRAYKGYQRSSKETADALHYFADMDPGALLRGG
jgi:tRNA A-37 threonylcarbamoyl transferase component Bud32